MINRAEARRRLRAARAVWRLRPEHPTFRDHAYLVYVTLLVLAVVAVPLIRAVVLALAEPTALALLSAPAASTVVSVCGAAAWIGALALGRRRGPVVPPPFVAQTLGDSSIPPSLAWGGRALRAMGAAVVLLTLGAALACSGFLVAAGGAGLPFIAGAALFAVPAAVLWLAGQALSTRAVTAVGVVLAAWAVLGLVSGAVPTPSGMLADLWSDAAFTTAISGAPPVAVLTNPGPLGAELAGSLGADRFVAVLAAIAVTAAAGIPLLLWRLSPQTVVVHAQQWEAMTLLARTGDLAGAAGRLRAPPAIGRRWRMPLTRPLWWATVQRDAVAAARNPARLLAALLTLAIAGALWGWMPGLPGSLAWIAGLPAALLCFAGLGPLCDGVRDGVDSAGRPPLFATPPGRLMVLHLAFPALAVVPIVAAGAAVAGGPWLAAAALGLFVLAVRAMDAAKPPLPIELLMPVPTPAGDASGMFVALWQSDAVLVTAAAGIWLAPALTADPAAATWLLTALLAVIAVAASRVRRAVR